MVAKNRETQAVIAELHRMMDELGLNQTAFCEKFGILRRNLVYWLAGQRIPPDYVMELLAFAVKHAEEYERRAE